MNILVIVKKLTKSFQITKEEIDKIIDFSFDNNLKIGFISPDLKQHSVYYFLTTVIEGLKKIQLLFIYLILVIQKILMMPHQA